MESFMLRAATCLLFALALFAPSTVRAQAPAKKPVSFINQIAPIFKESCFSCHEAKKRKGKLDMTTYENMRKGGDNEDSIVNGKPAQSLLVELITTKVPSKRMPKDGEPLTKEQIALVEQWITEGAKLDEGLTPKSDLPRELRLRWKPPAPDAAYHHSALIISLAFSPDNQKLVVGGQHELLIFDVNQGKLEKRIATRAERAQAMLFLPDGQLVVAGARPGQEGDVRVYNLSAGTPKMVDGVPMVDGVNDKAVFVKELADSDDSIMCLAITPDGKKLASGGFDRLVYIWDISGGIANAKLEQKIDNHHADCVFGVSFVPDGKRLLTCSRDKTAKVWDLEKKESLLTFPDHNTPVRGVVASRDGKFGYSVGEDKQLRTFNALGEGKQVRSVGGHGSEIVTVIQHPKQPLLASCSADMTVRLWNADNSAATKTLAGHTDWVYAIAFSPDGNLLASGAYNGEIKIWKVADGSLVKSFNATPGLKVANPNPNPAPVAPKK
jgi:WD40 repeat protein/mono/diheme cytochrome c family protein